ncbi:MULTISPECIES: transglutaminase-like domain-containing protein [Ramlibacter]|uniref:Transglutaminase domain-containing protein n=1 Tax=Ramlibacter aquaticus TaxID=2780094 RepID=A0ABR9SC27_9BURK|nr:MULTISPECIES: transglutaminase-like domain-containing protein [Ramlibacter]MBE7939856.1 transglutaminase domain-containing protein [Ramlibacter aquaticus]
MQRDPISIIDAETAPSWLGETRQLDITHPKVHITAQKLTQALQTFRERAVAIHDFVRRMPFAAIPDPGSITASEVLRRGGGDCHTKGLVFVALCRAAGFPARLMFVEVRTNFLRGVLSHGPQSMPHAVGQVFVDGHWHSTDGYVVDPLLFAQAKRQLRLHGLDSGWGIVNDAQPQWEGEKPCFQQFRSRDIRKTYGVFHDVAHFQAHHEQAGQGWSHGILYAIGARVLNRRVAQVRRLPADTWRRAPAGVQGGAGVTLPL